MMHPLDKSETGATAWGRLKVAVLIALVTGSGLTVALRFRMHLLWQYQSRSIGLRDVKAIPSRPMPASPATDNWVSCRVGQMTVSLPPEFAEHLDKAEEWAAATAFSDGSRLVVVSTPDDATGFAGLLRTASELCPHSRHYTLPRLRLACYQASSDDFRWSMTPEEIRWHMFLMSTGHVMRGIPHENTQTLFRAGLDGILCYHTDYAVFHWQSRDGRYEGTVWFRGGSDNPDWMRSVCRSVRVLPALE